MYRRLLLLGLIGPLSFAYGAVSSQSAGADPQGSIATAAVGAGGVQRMSAQHLPNPVRVNEKVISGGQPEGAAGFQELRDLGVKTVISVDGAKPDVDLARHYGLRYVHLPHGYDGIPEQRLKQLAKAVRDLDGPIYIHCHHGKHRSPAAASVACVAAGLLLPRHGCAVLELAGTSPNYRGLYDAAEKAQPLAKAELDQLEVNFRETLDVPPMAEAMVAIGHTHHHLTEIAAARWRSPAEHPDLAPAHEALMLREHFTELLRTPEVQHEAESFHAMLEASEADARVLEVGLRAGKDAAAAEKQIEAELLNQAFGRITANCKACHQQHRDVPLAEKRAAD